MNYETILNQKIQGIQPSGIRKFFDILEEMKDAISLGIGEPDFVTPWHIRDAGIYSLERGYTKYTSNAGMAELRRESTLAEAESWGLERIIALLARRPLADTPTGMRKALAALMRIGGDSFTLEAINATISGCGVHAHVEEKEIPGEVAVSFPDIPGIPKGFKEIREIIEDILPAHLGIEYVFWYITWEEPPPPPPPPPHSSVWVRCSAP